MWRCSGLNLESQFVFEAWLGALDTRVEVQPEDQSLSPFELCLHILIDDSSF